MLPVPLIRMEREHRIARHRCQAPRRWRDRRGTAKMRHGHPPGARADRRPRGLPARLPRHVRDARDHGAARRPARRDRDHGRPGPPDDGRQALHEGRALPRARLPPRSAAPSAEARRPERPRPLRARELGRSADGHRASASSASPPSIRSASCRTATPARWVSCRAKRWRSASSIGSARASSTARSARTAGAEALNYTLGSRIGTDVEQFQNAKLIVFWGTNAITSNLHLWTRAQEAKRRGAKLVAIDPYRSLTAEKCHEHIALLPGTDAALALGLMHVLVRERWLDEDYIEQYTLGADALLERARELHAGSASPRSAASRRGDREPRARLRADPAGRDPLELRHAARARRRQRRARDRLPAGARRALARCGRRPAAVVERRVPRRQRGAVSTRAARGPQAAHDQHEHDRPRSARAPIRRSRR